jgi:hypothetical protein
MRHGQGERRNVGRKELTYWSFGYCENVGEQEIHKKMQRFFNLLIALVGNMVSRLRIKSKTENMTPDTAFRFNSKN